MEIAGITRDRYSTFEAEDFGVSPFSQEVRKFSIPEKFNVPRFVLYNGISDPAAHLQFRRPPPEMVLLASRGLHLKLVTAPEFFPGEVPGP